MGGTTVLAADLGGTKCRFGVVTPDLEVTAVREVRTVMDRGQFLDAMDQAFVGLRGEITNPAEAPCAIGVGVAGVLLPDRDTLIGGPNLPLDGLAVASYLQDRHGLPTTVLNDGRASAWGEYLRGAARGRDPLLVLFFGTGIGIGLIIDGRPYEGATNAAGEIGHVVHLPGGRTCVCGRRGCYEAYCGGGPMIRRAAAEVGPPPDSVRWTVGDLVAAAAHDDRARAILDDAETAACAMVASACTLLNPAAVVLGGGVLAGWPALAGRVEAFAREWAAENVEAGLQFVASTGGSDAVLWGAARATGCL